MSVNAGIRKGQYQGQPSSYTLPRITDLADEVTRIGPGAYLWSVDLVRAYRQLRTCPLSTPLLGISLDGKIYIDTAPPFGCRTSSLACACTTNAVVYLMRKRGHHCMCYLDDFVGAAVSLEAAQEAYDDIIYLTDRLRLVLAQEKCVPPTKHLEWLGFAISVTDMTVRIPDDKLTEVLKECQAWKTKKLASRHELQRLVERLQHISKCI